MAGRRLFCPQLFFRQIQGLYRYYPQCIARAKLLARSCAYTLDSLCSVMMECTVLCMKDALGVDSPVLFANTKIGEYLPQQLIAADNPRDIAQAPLALPQVLCK